MSWETIEKRTGVPAGATADAVLCGVWQSGCFVIQIGADVMKRAKWKLGDRVALAVGNGDDAGRVRLAPAIATGGGFIIGPVGSKPSGKNAQIKTKHPALLGEPYALTVCAFSIEDGAIIFTLPSEKRPAQARSRKQAASPPPAHAAAPRLATTSEPAIADVDAARIKLIAAGQRVRAAGRSSWQIGVGPVMTSGELIERARRLSA